MFDGASNVQLGGELLKINYQKLTVMCGVELTVSLFFDDVSKITILNHMITSHKPKHNSFGFDIWNKSHYIFKSLSCAYKTQQPLPSR